MNYLATQQLINSPSINCHLIIYKLFEFFCKTYIRSNKLFESPLEIQIKAAALYSWWQRYKNLELVDRDLNEENEKIIELIEIRKYF